MSGGYEGEKCLIYVLFLIVSKKETIILINKSVFKHNKYAVMGV